jgi:hypothetical protein
MSLDISADPAPRPADGDLAALREAAGAGRPDAMMALADRLLVGRDAPFAPDEALGLIRRGAELNDPHALVRLATLTGAGAWTPQSWPDAFDLLVRAAEAGSLSARRQLLILSDDEALAARVEAAPDADPKAWRALAEGFDVTAWHTAPERRSLCEKPRIRVVEGFIKPAVCDWLISRADGRLHPGLMYNGRESVVMPIRNCSEFTFDIVHSDVVSLLVRIKISAATRLPVTAMEPTQIFHYGIGQEIRAHYDLVREVVGEARGASQSAGERIATFLIYLNHDYDGGELHFTLADVKFKGRTGDAIYFANVDEAGKAERLSLHLALPITRGEKWMASQWIQDRSTFG